MRRSRRPFIAPSFLCLTLATALVAAPASAAETAGDARQTLTGEDYRLFCGYLDALDLPAVKSLKTAKKRDQKIARMAKISPKKLKAAVAKSQKVGSTCDEIGKKMEADAGEAVKRALPGRVDLSVLDYDDPDHVVAAVTWKGGDKKLLEEEAALLARTLADEVPIVRTILVRGVNPLAPDKTADEATWFEAKITKERAARIDKESIKDFADTRYIRLFDNVVRN